MSSIVNKVKEALHSDKSSHSEGTHAHHEGRVGNTAYTGTGTGEYATGIPPNAESQAFGGVGATDGPATRTDGPHSSNIANKLDPRVDSDRDYSKNAGFNPSRTDGTGAYNVNESVRPGGYGENLPGREYGTTTGGQTAGFNTGLSSGIPEGTAGPHSSRLANAADPRVDSDLDGSRRLGSQHQHGHGAVSNEFGATGARREGEAFGTFGTGPAPNTAGPHKSDMLNKADPRVDSDLDGSKTFGGDKTFSRPGESPSYANRDPTDAAQVPPSVLQKHVGPPVIAHDDHTHDRARRHSSISHQDQHRGI